MNKFIFADATFSDFDQEKVDRMKGKNAFVLLTGKAGTGKTRFLYAAMNACREMQLLFKFFPMIEFVKECQSKVVEGMDREWQWIKELAKYEYPIYFDDFGSEKNSDFIRQDFFYLIDQRWQYSLPTRISTNLTLEQIAQTFDERMASRLASGILIHFGGSDRRLV